MRLEGECLTCIYLERVKVRKTLVDAPEDRWVCTIVDVPHAWQLPGMLLETEMVLGKWKGCQAWKKAPDEQIAINHFMVEDI